MQTRTLLQTLLLGILGLFALLELWLAGHLVLVADSRDLSKVSRGHRSRVDSKAADGRILCWIMTHPANLDKQAATAYNTWGRRCDVTLVVSDVMNTSVPLPVINITVKAGRDHLLAKTMLAFDYIYQHHFHDADWFMKADDDTYVIVENLRHFLSKQNKDDPVLFGHHFYYDVMKVHYMSGGAGYVISKETLRRLGTRAPEACLMETRAPEDGIFGMCMKTLGVHIPVTYDQHGLLRFNCFNLYHLLTGSYPDWFKDRDPHGYSLKGIRNISREAISFHYVVPEIMLMMEYLVYDLDLQ